MYNIDSDKEVVAIQPEVFEPVSDWVIFGTSRRDLSVDELPSSPAALSGNMSPDIELLTKTYVTLGTSALRLDWIKQQQQLAEQRRDLLLAKLALPSVKITPLGGEYNLSDQVNSGCLIYGDDNPTLHFVLPQDRVVGQLHVTPSSLSSGQVYHTFDGLRQAGFNIPETYVFAGPHAHANPWLPNIQQLISNQLTANDIKTERIEFASENTTEDRRYFSNFTSELRYGANTQVIGIKPASA